MSDEDEVRTLVAELEALRAEATQPQPDGQERAKFERQIAIKARLTTLGHPVD